MDDMIRFNELSQKLHSKGVVVLQNDFRLKTPLQEKFISTAKKVSEEYNYDLKIIRLDESFNQSDYTKVVNIDTSAVTEELNLIVEYIKQQNNVEIKKLTGLTLEQDLSIFINEVKKQHSIQIIQEVVVTEERDKFYNGVLFKENDVVEESGNIYEVLELGSNYLTVVNPSGQISKKWPAKVTTVFNSPTKFKIEEGVFVYKGYRAENLSQEQITKYSRLANETDDSVGLLIQLRMENIDNNLSEEMNSYSIIDESGKEIKQNFKTKESAYNYMIDKMGKQYKVIGKMGSSFNPTSETNRLQVIAKLSESDISIPTSKIDSFINSINQELFIENIDKETIDVIHEGVKQDVSEVPLSFENSEYFKLVNKLLPESKLMLNRKININELAYNLAESFIFNEVSAKLKAGEVPTILESTINSIAMKLIPTLKKIESKLC